MMENPKSEKKKEEFQVTKNVVNNQTETIIDTNVQREFQNILIAGEYEHDQPCCSWKITGLSPAQTKQEYPEVIKAEDSSVSTSIDISCPLFKDNVSPVQDDTTDLKECISCESAVHCSDVAQSDSLTNLFDDLEYIETETAARTTYQVENQQHNPSLLDAKQLQASSSIVTIEPKVHSSVLTSQPQSSLAVTNQLQINSQVVKPQSQEITNQPRSQVGNNQTRSQVVNNQPRSQVVNNQPRSQVVTNQPRSQVITNQPQSQLVNNLTRSQVVNNQPRSPVFTNQSRSQVVACQPFAQPPTVNDQPRVHFSSIQPTSSEPPASSRVPHIINIPNDSINRSLQRTDTLVNIPNSSTNRASQLTNPTLGPPPSYSKSLLNRRINPCASIQFMAPIPPPSYDGMESELRYAHTLGHTGQFTLGLGNTWQGQPQPAYCPVCETVIITQVDIRVSRTAHVFAIVMLLLLCWPFCLLPYFLNVCNYTFHFCSVCQSYLGARRPFQRG